MSYPTKPTFVYKGSWDENTRKHPCMKSMETFTKAFDERQFLSKWYTPDTSLIKGDGTEIKGRDNVVEALKQLYGPFTAQYHEPSFVMCSETDDGWEMLGQATLFVNLPGEPAAGEKKVKDASGKEWDTGVPSGFHFYYKKDDNADNGLGMYFKRTEIMSDSGVPMSIMLRRGLIKASDLGL